MGEATRGRGGRSRQRDVAGRSGENVDASSSSQAHSPAAKPRRGDQSGERAPAAAAAKTQN